MKYKLLLGIIALFQTLPSFAADTSKKCIVGYGYSAHSISKIRQEHFYMGFEYGLKQGYKDNPAATGPCATANDYQLILEYDASDNPIGALKVATRLINRGAAIIAGFPASHGALLAAKVAQKNQVGILLPGASASDLETYSDYMFSMSPGRYKHSSKTVSYFAKHFKGKNILAVIKKDSVFSMDILKNLQRVNQELGNPINIIPAYISKNTIGKIENINQFKSTNITAAYMAPYPIQSKEVYKQLTEVFENKIQYFGSSAWLSMDTSIINNIPMKYKNNLKVFSTTRLDKDSRANTRFHKIFLKEFGKEPEREANSGYILGYVAADILRRSKATSKEAILDSLRTTTCINMDDHDQKQCRTPSGFAKRKIDIFRWDPQGFKKVHEKK